MKSKYTPKQRGDIYLKVAESLVSGEEIFVCNEIQKVLSLHSNNISKYDFPELFMFKESKVNAWLSKQIYNDGFGMAADYEPFNFIKSIVLLFCAEMTKTENL